MAVVLYFHCCLRQTVDLFVKNFHCPDYSYRDGREYEAQHVLATPALGYLKKNLNLFSPPLPERLQQVSMKVQHPGLVLKEYSY